MRRFGEPVETGKPYRRRPGAYGILLRGRDVLLTHQMSPNPEFQLPGGGIDPGESPVQALHREVMEETGWCISGIRRCAAYRRYVFMPEYDMWAEKVCLIYVANPVMAKSRPHEDGHEAVWMPAEDAVAVLASPGDAACLSELLDPAGRRRRG